MMMMMMMMMIITIIIIIIIGVHMNTIHEAGSSEDLSMYANQIHLHSTICSSYFTSRDVCKIILKTDYMPRNVCRQSVSHWKYFREILYWGLLLKSVDQIRF